MPLDYETLRIIWWVILGVLLIGFAIMDGFDLGVAMLLPIIAKNDIEKRVLINSIGPTWEGNQVWFILAGGAIFAAWPMLYALSFSGFYLAMLVVLLALILRPVGFKYRSKLAHTTWRSFWDAALFLGGFIPALIFGVAVGNVVQGVPFYFDESLRPFYTGTFWGLLNPFAILCGLVSVSMLTMHGAFFINIKTEGVIQQRAIRIGRLCALFTMILFVIGGIWSYFLEGYQLSSVVLHDGPSNPLHKAVIKIPAALFNNYQSFVLTRSIPIMALVAAFVAVFTYRKPLLSFVSSALSIMGIIATVGVSMYPFILPSSTNPDHSLLLWDSSSSQLTLFIMLGATLIFLPLVLLYTSWVYRVLRGKVNEASILTNDSSY